MNAESSSRKKVALVTGASRGIGAAVALELATRGFSVAINYRARIDAAAHVATQLEKLGSKALVLQADVSQADEVKSMFREIDATFGRIDALVCSAGAVRDTLLGASEPTDFEAVMAVNLKGVVNCCREASKRMVAQRGGTIVNLSSVAAQHPGRGQSNYAASKGAVESFTRAMAVELAPRGIRVNAVAPGVIATEMSSTVRELAGDEITQRILLRRPGEAHEVAKVVAFLCSDDASYVTGQVWKVDGGFKLQ